MRVVRETERVGGKALAALSAVREQFTIYKGLCSSPTECRAAARCLGKCADAVAPPSSDVRTEEEWRLGWTVRENEIARLKEALKAAQSAIRTIKYLVRSGGECPGDWLCKDIPEVQAALCDTLYGRRKDLDADEIHEIGQYLAQVQKMSKRELHYTFEDGWLTIIKVIQTEQGAKHG
jgi:hypothetical protein